MQLLLACPARAQLHNYALRSGSPSNVLHSTSYVVGALQGYTYHPKERAIFDLMEDSCMQDMWCVLGYIINVYIHLCTNWKEIAKTKKGRYISLPLDCPQLIDLMEDSCMKDTCGMCLDISMCTYVLCTNWRLQRLTDLIRP